MSEIKVDTVAEKTSANGVTVDGLNIKDSKLVTANSVITSNITDANITTAKIADVNVTEGKIADNAITLAKMASGTDGNIISYDASGNPVAIATGNDGQVLTSTGAGSPPAFETLASANNLPAFEAYKPSNQDINDATYTKVSFATQLFDITNVYDADVYSRFTPGVAGKYYIYTQIMYETPGGHELDLAILAIYKNGNRIKYANQDLDNNVTLTTTITCSTVVDSDTNDYFEVFAYLDRTSSGTVRLVGNGSDGQTCSFGAYKINT